MYVCCAHALYWYDDKYWHYKIRAYTAHIGRNTNRCRTDNSVIDASMLCILYFLCWIQTSWECRTHTQHWRFVMENDWYNLINLISLILIFISFHFHFAANSHRGWTNLHNPYWMNTQSTAHVSCKHSIHSKRIMPVLLGLFSLWLLLLLLILF